MPASPETRRNIVIGVVVAAVLVAAVVVGFLVSRSNDDDVKDVVATEPGVTLTIGPDDAPHRIVIYEDFICPYCGELERRTSDRLAELAEEGKVQVEYRPFQLLPIDYSRQALEVFQVVLHQGDTTVAKQLHDLLYANQPAESGPFPSQDDLVALAVKAGADEAKLRDVLSTAQASSWAQEATDKAQSAGVMSTPTVLLDGKEFTDGRTVDDLADNLIAAVS